MAAPFYSQADQDIYQSGNRFIPQEQYRLNYTPPAIMGQNTNAGITSTGAANPYKWPWPIGGGEYDQGISGTQVTKRPLGLSPGALGGKLPGFKNWASRTLGDVQDLYSKLPTPGNILKWGIDKYQSSKAEKEEEEAKLTAITRSRAINKMKEKYKDPNYIPPTTGGGGDVIPTNGGTTGGYEPANVGQQTSTDRADWGYDPFAQGGRIGYANGEFVDEDINIQGPGFDVNENIEMASGEGEEDILQQLYVKYIEAGFPPEVAEKMALQEFEQMAAGPEQDQGIASLV